MKKVLIVTVVYILLATSQVMAESAPNVTKRRPDITSPASIEQVSQATIPAMPSPPSAKSGLDSFVSSVKEFFARYTPKFEFLSNIMRVHEAASDSKGN